MVKHPFFSAGTAARAALCLALCLVLPFLTGQIPQMGAALTPMHLPVLLCGYLCGGPVAALVGLAAPLLRCVLFGTPLFPLCLSMAAELAAYGFFSGWLYRRLPRTRWGLWLSLLGAMLLGRLVWGSVQFLLLGMLGQPFTLALFWAGAFVNSLPGILCQLILVPLLVMGLDRAGYLSHFRHPLPCPTSRLTDPQFSPLLDAIDDLLSCGEASVTVAIDGMAAAGKSTLGTWLAERYHCPLIHMDDFFLPAELRTTQRLSTPGGNVHYERFREEVLTGLSSGEAFSYGVFDCRSMSVTGRRTVSPCPLTVIEGAYSLHPALRDFYDLRVFCSVDPDVQLRRIEARGGKRCVPYFRDKWIPLENAYFSGCGVRECCHIVL